jgi:signal transduction histidine kinase
MITIGWWVASRVSRTAVEDAGAAAALYMESSVAPLVQELAWSAHLAEETREKLDQLLAQRAISERVISMRIWRLDGTIAYSKWKELIGTIYPMSESFRKAAAGDISAGFDEHPDGHDAHERAIASDLIEIYAPVREAESRRVIAVAEFYARGDKLRAHVRREIASSWLIVAHVTFFMMAALWGIVVRGGRIIGEQRLQLSEQIGELQGLLAQNEELRVRLQRANTTAAAANERFLRRIGSDLHDGPAQLLSYSLLRLHKFAPIVEKNGAEKDRQELAMIREALGNTLREVRNISEGLALPELDQIPLAEVIELAISSHERLTHTRVERSLDVPIEVAPQALKICAYRFVQEGLTNAFRHAGANGQCVTARANGTLEIAVSDGGPGFDPGEPRTRGLGLAGMRARIEAIGGRFAVASSPGGSTRLSAHFDMDRMRNKEEAVDG